MENDDLALSPNGTRKRDQFTETVRNDANLSMCCCKYCGEIVVCETDVMWNHLETDCEEYRYREGRRQKVLAQDVVEEESRVHDGDSNWYEEAIEEGKEVLTKTIVVTSLPLRTVEGDGFRHLCTFLGPWFKIPSQKEIARDALRLFMDEKKKLRSSLVSNSQRVCLTTDIWTSLQNTRHLRLTAHYIDSEWKLQKKVLGFRQVPDQKDVTIGKMIEDCLLDWGIDKVFTITSDHASLKEETISYIKKRLKNWNGCVLDGEFLHMKCCAHNINLVVTEALKEFHECISSIRHAVKYIRSSLSRLQKFKECVQIEKIECKGLVALDVPTCWSTTYLMLEAALRFQKAFERLAEEDEQLLSYYMDNEDGKKRIGPPSSDDWDTAKALVRCLMKFHDASSRLNVPLIVTSNACFHKICEIQASLHCWSQSEDSLLSVAACSIRRKCDGYLGSITNINKLLFISHVLDPRYNIKYLKHCLNIVHGVTVATEMTERAEDFLKRSYEFYSTQVPNETQTSNGKGKERDNAKDFSPNKFNSIYWMLKMGDSVKNEVDTYLSEYTEYLRAVKFDLLDWWKSNSYRYPVLSQMARDVLAVPVSTTGSESAFDTEGRIFDPLRTAMSTCCPRTLEALICSQSWLSSSPAPIVFPDYMDDFAEYEEIESELSKNATHFSG